MSIYRSTDLGMDAPVDVATAVSFHDMIRLSIGDAEILLTRWEVRTLIAMLEEAAGRLPCQA